MNNKIETIGYAVLICIVFVAGITVGEFKENYEYNRDKIDEVATITADICKQRVADKDFEVRKWCDDKFEEAVNLRSDCANWTSCIPCESNCDTIELEEKLALCRRDLSYSK